ncbi:MAG: AMP-binding protein [Azoarcus sp.]|nr:AMP-binding protein [Azoarcus sp.]
MRPWPEALFEAIAARGNAEVLGDGVRVLNGAQVLAEVEARVARLMHFDCQRVALALDNGISWVLWDLALLRAGCVCVPVPGFFSAGQKRHVLDSAGVDSLVCDALEPWLAHGFMQVEHGLARRSVADAPALPDGTLKITYTSGTTGQPKGVCLGVEALFAVAGSIREVTAPCGVERHLCVLPLAVLLENVAGVYASLLAGVEVVLPSLDEVGFTGSTVDVQRLVATLARHAPHSLILMPQLLQVLVAAAERGAPLRKCLRFVAVGGARVSPDLLRRAVAAGLPVFEGYGLTECASVVCLNTPAARRIGAVGRPLPHCALRIDAAGEVWVRGPHMLGYAGESPLASEWIATGDLGRIENGFLELLGRRKSQFITAWGRNVSPEWVEAELTACSTVAQAWLYGEALSENVAVLVPRSAAAELAAAVAAVNAGLPDYLRVHRWLRADIPFTAANGFATANGRLCRDALVAHYLPAIERLFARDRLTATSTGEPA